MTSEVFGFDETDETQQELIDLYASNTEKFEDISDTWSLAPNVNEPVLIQISELELSVTPRRIREATLGVDNGWLADVDAKIKALRKKLV